MKKLFLILAITLIACNTSKQNQTDNFVEGELLVGFTNKEVVPKTIKTLETIEGVRLVKMLMDSGDTQIAHFKVPAGKENEYIKLFSKNPNVKYAEVNGIVTTQPVLGTNIEDDIKNEVPITDAMMSDYATLTVTKIDNGKDGYTATLKNDTGSLFICTISIPNLGDNYVRLNIGDKVKIAGEYAESDPVQIFAKRILKVD